MYAAQFAPQQLRPQQLLPTQTTFDLSGLINMIVPIIGLALMISIIKPMMKGFGEE